MPKFLRSKWFLFLLAGIILLGIGGAYYYVNNEQAAQAAEEPAIQTATVRQGEIVVSATGAGTVIPAEEVSPGFRGSGILAELAVQVGDEVEAGDVLARLDDTAAREKVTQAEIALRQAELQLQQLLSGADAASLAAARSALATAQADLARLTTPPGEQDIEAAQQNLRSAQLTLNSLLAGPTAEEIAGAKADLELATVALQQAQADYDKVAWRSDIGELPQALALQQATTAYEKARANYDLATAGAEPDRISAARAQVASAQSALDALQNGPEAEDIAAAEARVEQAQAALDDLLTGASAIDEELAQLNVKQAQNNLASAQKELADAELSAPIAGVITAVDAQVGENVGAAPIISLADLDQPLLEIFLDETDLDKVGVGYEVEVVFDAFPDDTFIGRVEQVDPSLALESGTSVVRALVRLDESSFAKPVALPIGLNATVEVIGGRASNAMLVPVEALREISPGQYAVFVMKDGEPTLTFVEVGLMDFTFAEILSGLEPGDVVTTGIVETK
jgi:multidrug efflux pump subunit AcrA (membrane-fusion protein)